MAATDRYKRMNRSYDGRLMRGTDTNGFRIGGVPEHFNLPWHLLHEEAPAGEPGSDFEWQDYSTGTGAMIADLAAKKLDIAILLTEGVALGLARGLPIEAISLYTRSSLIWGIHVAPDSLFDRPADLAGARFAISRHGSGSHLMSLALALEQGWPAEDCEFVIVDNLPGAIRAFAAGQADAFLWERFTTAPEVEAGRLRRVGDFVSPWPAWVVCATRDVWQANPKTVRRLIAAVAGRAGRLAQDPDSAALIARRYGLHPAAVREWLQRTEWTTAIESPDAALQSASRVLETAGAI